MAVSAVTTRERTYTSANGDLIALATTPGAGETLPLPSFNGPRATLFVTLAASRTTDTTLAIEAGQFDGQELVVCVRSANTLTIKDSAGTAFGADLEVTSAQAARLIWDAVGEVWRRS